MGFALCFCLIFIYNFDLVGLLTDFQEAVPSIQGEKR
jgi:hypothetical protein